MLDSLAFRYATIIETLERLTGDPIAGVHVVGGGSRNDYLNQATANATARPVLAGPVEATSLGNALMQSVACGKTTATRWANADPRAPIRLASSSLTAPRRGRTRKIAIGESRPTRYADSLQLERDSRNRGWRQLVHDDSVTRLLHGFCARACTVEAIERIVRVDVRRTSTDACPATGDTPRTPISTSARLGDVRIHESSSSASGP